MKAHVALATLLVAMLAGCAEPTNTTLEELHLQPGDYLVYETISDRLDPTQFAFVYVADGETLRRETYGPPAPPDALPLVGEASWYDAQARFLGAAQQYDPADSRTSEWFANYPVSPCETLPLDLQPGYTGQQDCKSSVVMLVASGSPLSIQTRTVSQIIDNVTHDDKSVLGRQVRVIEYASTALSEVGGRIVETRLQYTFAPSMCGPVRTESPFSVTRLIGYKCGLASGGISLDEIAGAQRRPALTASWGDVLNLPLESTCRLREIGVGSGEVRQYVVSDSCNIPEYAASSEYESLKVVGLWEPEPNLVSGILSYTPPAGAKREVAGDAGPLEILLSADEASSGGIVHLRFDGVTNAANATVTFEVVGLVGKA